jgi:hypothetical protein
MSRSNAYLFVEFLKGTRGYYFYSPQDKKILATINAIFLEDKYTDECGSKCWVILEETKRDNPKQMVLETHNQNFCGGFISLSLNLPDSSGREIDITPSIPIYSSARVV